MERGDCNIKLVWYRSAHRPITHGPESPKGRISHSSYWPGLLNIKCPWLTHFRNNLDSLISCCTGCTAASGAVLVFFIWGWVIHFGSCFYWQDSQLDCLSMPADFCTYSPDPMNVHALILNMSMPWKTNCCFVMVGTHFEGLPPVQISCIAII